MRLILPLQDLDDSEGLIVHNRYHFDGFEDPAAEPNPKIMEPRDLRGKKVGVWWASSQHYCLIRMLEQMQIPYENAVDHYYKAQPPTRPSHWEPGEPKVTVVPVTREDMWKMWEKGSIHAAWVGFPHLHFFKASSPSPFLLPRCREGPCGDTIGCDGSKTARC